jgi:DNA repair protein RecO (recombination protein O)
MKRGCAVLVTSKSQSKIRISDEPAFVLHRYDWSESSLVLDVFTRHLGRLALVAKGAKRPHSNLRPVLMPLQPLELNFSGEQEVRTLTAAHWRGGHVFPRGDSLLAGFYLNELVLKLLAREDPHEQLFDLYAQVVQILASGLEPTLWPLMRAFELLILRGLGLLPNLDAQSANLQPLKPNEQYTLLAPLGLMSVQGASVERMGWEVSLTSRATRSFTGPSSEQEPLVEALVMTSPTTTAVASSGLSQLDPTASWGGGGGGGGVTGVAGGLGAGGAHQHGLSGERWETLARALQSNQPLTQTLRVCAEMQAFERASLQSQLRAWLTHHCGGVGLKTRQFMVDIHAL